MYGCYTKKQAAGILNVSERHIGGLLSAGTLRRFVDKRLVWIPKEDVDRLYTETKLPVLEVHTPTPSELEQRLIRLEAGFETLKLGLGFGAPSKPRCAEALELLYRTHLSLLADRSWSLRSMSQVADEMMALQEGEVLLLGETKGSKAWVPLVDLVMRMVHQLETDPEYPQKGMDVLHTRLIRAKDRFYGVLYATSKPEVLLHSARSGQLLTATEIPPTAIESHILSYILA